MEDLNLITLEPGRQVGNWIVERQLGTGAFGAVYRCKSTKKDGIYALKVEGANEEIQLLKMELVVLTELKKVKTRHFCMVEDKGREQNFVYMVMTLVGRSLQDLRLELPNQKFSLGTAIGAGIQCLEALEELHSIGYLHRDVKPGNFTIGRVEAKELRKIYILDFGMCRKFIEADGTIKVPREAAGFRGTVKYAPVACHLEKDLCRSDDCEAWLYMLVELTTGSLPWRTLTNIEEIGVYKKNCRVLDQHRKELFGGCPREYIDIMGIIDNTEYFEEPRYGLIYRLLRQSLKKVNVPEFPYDWEDEEMKLADAVKQGGEQIEKEQEKERKDRKKKEEAAEGVDKKKEKEQKVKAKKAEEPEIIKSAREPNKSLGGVKSTKSSTKTTKSAKTTKTPTSTKSAKSSATTKSSKSATPSKPAKTGKSSKSQKSAEPVMSAESPKSAKSASQKSSKSQTKQTAKSKSAKSRKSSKSAESLGDTPKPPKAGKLGDKLDDLRRKEDGGTRAAVHAHG